MVGEEELSSLNRKLIHITWQRYSAFPLPRLQLFALFWPTEGLFDSSDTSLQILERQCFTNKGGLKSLQTQFNCQGSIEAGILLPSLTCIKPNGFHYNLGLPTWGIQLSIIGWVIQGRKFWQPVVKCTLCIKASLISAITLYTFPGCWLKEGLGVLWRRHFSIKALLPLSLRI